MTSKLASDSGARKAVSALVSKSMPVVLVDSYQDTTQDFDAAPQSTLTFWVGKNGEGRVEVVDSNGHATHQCEFGPRTIRLRNHEYNAQDVFEISGPGTDGHSFFCSVYVVSYGDFHALCDFVRAQSDGKLQLEYDSNDDDDIGIYGSHCDAVGTALLHSDVSVVPAEIASEIARSLYQERFGRSESSCVKKFEQPEQRFLDEVVRSTLVGLLEDKYRQTVAREGEMADFKLVMTPTELGRVIGMPLLDTLQRTLGASVDQVKLRRVAVTPDREVINFHLDHAQRTLGIALNDASEYTGSKLVYAVPGEGLVSPRRQAGFATVHDNSIPHGVTPLLSGLRYGLFLLHHGGAAKN